MSKNNRNEALRLPFEICAEAACMGFWDYKNAYDTASKQCEELGRIHETTKGRSKKITASYHDALVEKNDYAEQLIALALVEIKNGSFLMDRENLETYAEELAYDIAIADIKIRSLQSDNIYLSPVFRF